MENGTRTVSPCGLLTSCRCRWCLTGTPLQNKPEDIQSLLAFVRAAPLDDIKVFNRAISRPIKEGDPEGLTRLRVLLRAVCLRRTKSILDKTLPPKVVEVHKLRLEVAATVIMASREAFFLHDDRICYMIYVCAVDEVVWVHKNVFIYLQTCMYTCT